MSGTEFEKYCSNLLLLTGCFNGSKIRTTKKASDYGADLILDCIDGFRVSIQCKRLIGNVGVNAIQEVVGSKKHYNAQAAAVITNSDYTRAAKILASDNCVVLIDRKLLAQLIELKNETLNDLWNRNQWESFLQKVDTITKARKKTKSVSEVNN